MYSNNKKGFSILDLLVKIIFAALFIFILIWLFQKRIPKINMNPFYSNVFRENLKYMQDAGESYFTDDKMPSEIGETTKITLEEMEKMNLIIPFVDKDGKSCDVKNSYVNVTKLESGYELKTNLVCGKEANYVVKILGCHNYCPTGECEKKCHIEKITEYEFKKVVKGTKTVYSCPKGYKLNGKNCIKTTLKNTKAASIRTTETTTVTKPAKAVEISGVKTLVATLVNDKKVQLTTNVSTKKTELTVTKTYVPATTKTERQAYDCTKSTTEKKCSTTYHKESYSCNCSSKFVGGVLKTSCDVCYKSVPVQTCKDVKKEYTDTCYRDVTVTVTKAHYEYSCPAGTTVKEGKDASLKCYKTEKVYSCPTGTTVKEGKDANLKCYKTEKVYSCPANTDVVEGSGSNTKCYKVSKGSVKYECESGWTLKDKTCSKVSKASTEEKYCKDKNYKLENGKCNLYETKKVKATSKKVNTTSTKYKWSTSETLKGYTKTGKTRTKDGKKICE